MILYLYVVEAKRDHINKLIMLIIDKFIFAELDKKSLLVGSKGVQRPLHRKIRKKL